MIRNNTTAVKEMQPQKCEGQEQSDQKQRKEWTGKTRQLKGERKVGRE